MTSKHMKRCTISLVISENLINAIIWHLYTPTIVVTLKMTGNIKCLQGCRVTRILCAVDGTINWYDHFAYPITEQFHFWVCSQGKHVHVYAQNMYKNVHRSTSYDYPYLEAVNCPWTLEWMHPSHSHNWVQYRNATYHMQQNEWLSRIQRGPTACFHFI